MTETMYIGSGDVNALLSPKDSITHIRLMQRFVSGTKPYYNAKSSPIDALRTGAILEERYLLILPDNYYAQYRATSAEMDVFKCTLDFAEIEAKKIINFEELKTINLLDYFDLYEEGCNTENYVKKKYKNYYNQVQEQLYCTELDEATITFLPVFSYEDSENIHRNIEPGEAVKIRIHRDEDTIALIKERGKIFQQIKDYYTEK